SFLFAHTPSIYFYSLSLHDALPIFSFWPLTLFSQTSFLLWMNLVSPRRVSLFPAFSSLPNPFPVKRLPEGPAPSTPLHLNGKAEDRKSTRLNSSHVSISYAVFCLKK